ncbi:hypothetical protein MMC29_001523 [Sticta canariensis]|nr:hypothetical protein [Sticta canariensis]
MVLSRASVRQTTRLVNQSFKVTRSNVRTRSWQQVHRRAYASGGDHGQFKAGSDLPWAITSTVVTAPCIWYLWPESKKKDAHGHGHDEHKGHEEDGEASSDEGGEHSLEDEEAGEDSTPKQEEKEAEKSESEGEEEQQPDTPETSDDDAGDDPHEMEGGGNGDGPAQDDDATVQEPDNVQDKPLASKPAGGQGTQSGKQEGLDNADTKHSPGIATGPEKSHKPEGSLETAKLKGTVDPSRPQA